MVEERGARPVMGYVTRESDARVLKGMLGRVTSTPGEWD